MASLTTVRMAESSGGGPGSIQQVACIFCAAPLPHPSAPFCIYCGFPQKKCINSQCGGPISPGASLCHYCGTPQQSQKQSDKKCINPQCGALLLHSMDIFCITCGAPQDTAMFQQFLSAVHCISCSTKLLVPHQKICHCCGAAQSTQTSMIHKGQQPLPHVSQPSHSHVFNPSQTSLLSHQVTPKHACTEADVPHSHLLTSQSPHIPKPTLHPHSVQSSVSPTRSTVHHQNVFSATEEYSPDSDTNSISKRNKVKIRVIMQHLNIDVLLFTLIYNCWSTTKMLKLLAMMPLMYLMYNVHACMMMHLQASTTCLCQHE